MKFGKFILPTQKMLFGYLRDMYKGRAIVKKGSYILVKGKAPIMLLAHMDTVHKHPVSQICKTLDGNIMMSPQGIGGDDRCGVYAIATIRNNAKVKPWLLFTCDEEIGGVGARKFVQDLDAGKLPKELWDLKCLVEIDRKGANDAVYYDCANTEFEDYITSKGFRTNYGSFSDISVVAPALGIAAVNLSSGYYNAHTLHEYINLAELQETIRRAGEIVADAANPKFPTYEYIYNDYEYFLNGFNSKKNENDPLEKKEFASMYDELLDYYTGDELNELIEEFGQRIIREIYETELVGSYYENGWY